MTLLEFPDEEVAVQDGIVLDFSISRIALNKAMAEVASVVPNRDLIPVLKNLQFVVTDEGLRITGSDGIISAVTHVGVFSVSTTGTAVFPASRLISLAREADGSDIKIRVASKKSKMFCAIKSDKTTWKFPLMSPQGFPDFSTHDAEGLQTTDRMGLLTALTQVRKAVSNDSMRPYLTLVDIAKGRARGTDGMRLHQAKVSFPFECQIPGRGLTEIVSRLTASNELEIEVGEVSQALLYRFDQTLLIVQKVAAVFPDMDEILLTPNLTNDLLLTVSRTDLYDAVKRARVTADEDTSAIILSLNKGAISIECKDRKGGVTVETVDATWEHPVRHVSLNHQHLLDMLSSTKAEKCVFRLGKDLKTKATPLIFEDPDTGFVSVLSQIRVDWI